MTRAVIPSGLGVAREIIAAEAPEFYCRMIGNNDRQPIREKGSATAAEWRAGGERAAGSVGYRGRPAQFRSRCRSRSILPRRRR